MQIAIELGNPGTPGLVGSTARQSRSPFPLCFDQTQAVGIIVDALALRDEPPLDTNRGRCEEKRKERGGKERGRERKSESGGVQRLRTRCRRGRETWTAMFIGIFKAGYPLNLFKRRLGPVSSPKTDFPRAKAKIKLLNFLLKTS